MIRFSLYGFLTRCGRKFWLLGGFSLLMVLPQAASAEPWKRHVVDDSSQGADGVRMKDVNGDGLLDCCTAWEEGGVVRVYLNPGHARAKEKWPAVTVGEVISGEDAVFCDLDGDGRIDVVSCCEGDNKKIYFHWAPKSADAYLKQAAWKTEIVPAAKNRQKWMYCAPMQVDGKRGIDLIVGSKMKGGAIGWLESPENPRDVAAWKYHKLSPAGWTMSIETLDMDSDGDLDVLISDRQRKGKGVRWLENPGVEGVGEGADWKNHFVGGRNSNVKFLTVTDWDGDGVDEVLAATRNRRFLVLDREGAKSDDWVQHEIENPNKLPWGKAIRAVDVNLDGRLDLVHVGNTRGDRRYPAVVWMEAEDLGSDKPKIKVHDIGGPEGAKYDLIQMIDLDGDGDLDLMTCEERDNLGVVWYENPTR